MKTTFVRKISAFLLVGALACLLCLAAFAGDLAPYAESGDMDYIPYYRVTVDPREDGSADITYEIDWQVIDGDKTDYLSSRTLNTAATAAATPRSPLPSLTTPPTSPPRSVPKAGYTLRFRYTRATCSA